MSTVELRPFSEKDEAMALEMLRNTQISKTYLLPDMTEQEAKERFARFITLSQQADRYVRGVYLGELLIGWINDVGIDGDSLELGWVIHPKYHNRGYATAAAKIAVAELFAAGFRQVIAGAFEENIPSFRVMEKVGMTRRELTEQLEYRGKVHTCLYYGICRETE